jgi:hypothetical protein
MIESTICNYLNSMLRSTATFDLFSMKHLNHHYTMKSSSLTKRTNMAYGDSTSSSTHSIHDPTTAAMLPTTLTYFEVASPFSSSFSTNFNCTKDIREAFSLSSIMKIDGPATRALEHSIRTSKRRLASESIDGGSTVAPKRKKNPSETDSTAHSNSMPLLSDWNNVYNSLITTVPVDETIPTRMNEPFPIIEYTFDDTDIIVPECS